MRLLIVVALISVSGALRDSARVAASHKIIAAELRGGSFPFSGRIRWFTQTYRLLRNLRQQNSRALRLRGSKPQHLTLVSHVVMEKLALPQQAVLSDCSTSAESRAADSNDFEAVQQALTELSAAYKKLAIGEQTLIARALQSSNDLLGSELSESLHTDAPQMLQAASVTKPAAPETTVAAAVSGSGSDNDAASSKVLFADEILKGSDVSLTAAELEKLVECMLDDTMSTDEFKNGSY
jgi:hypothetical protein